MISLADAEPLDVAVRKMNAKTPVARALRSAEWADVPLAIRERAFFTAQFAKADVLQEMHDYLGKRIGLEAVPSGRGEVLASRSDFVRQMRRRLGDGGYVPRPGKEGTLQDMTSRGRLGLIFDINTQSAQEFARWKAGHEALDAFPAQELYREEGRMVPRNWIARWRDAGGEFFGGRMIALKTDDVWHKINRFGVPWPPFDFGSGMGVRDISREEARELGVLGADEEITDTPEEKFNDRLEKSVERYAPEILESVLRAFGDQVKVEAGVAMWRANLIVDFVEKAAADKTFKGEVSLGVATKRTVEAAKSLADLDGYELKLTADETRHAIKKHGEGNETDKKQAGLTPQDFARLPELWRAPDEVLPGDPQKPGTLKVTKDIDGILTMVTWRMSQKNKTVYLQTLWKKKKSGKGAA